MKLRSPTLEGFRVIFSCPSVGLAEIAWRWSVGAAASLLIGFSAFEYLDTLPVSRGDLLLLQTAQPVLIYQAVQHIFRGSALRVVETAIVLALTLGIAWVVVASLARAATIKALLTRFRNPTISTSHQPEKKWRLRSLCTLNSFRLGTTLAAAIGLFAAFLLGGAVSRPDNPAPGSVLLIILALAMLVWISWSTLNWFFSLAAIFVIGDGQNTLGAIASSVDLCRARTASVFAAGTWFGLAHLTAFVVASSVVAFPLGFASVLPGAVVLGGVLLVTLLYFAIADFLYVGRLAAYVAIVELPESPVALSELAPRPDNPQHPAVGVSSSQTRVDPAELILSDVSLATGH